ncbi:MAG: type II toxin-antitoxin system VapC family toxin [Limisphaerales bacterium]
MIVTDCTVIARLIIRAEDPGPVDSLFQRDHEWTAPSLWQAEFASVLNKYERAGRLSPDGIAAMTRKALELFAQATRHVSIGRVLETARRTGCSTYDSYYIALAEDLNLKLYTYDAEILKKCPRLARTP